MPGIARHCLSSRSSFAMRRLWFTLAYLFTRPRWDTNITPPELIALIEGQGLPLGRALDLGCGTGTNVIYLAKRGWQTVGVDFVGRAIATAKRKAGAVGAAADFYQGDVSRLDFLQPPFDLALDIGCFHSLASDRRLAYVAGLRRLLRPGALFLCYAFKPEAPMGGIGVDEMQRLFEDGFTCVQVEHGEGVPSAWYTFERKKPNR
jgi:SAM-dependent methyltransferase